MQIAIAQANFADLARQAHWRRGPSLKAPLHGADHIGEFMLEHLEARQGLAGEDLLQDFMQSAHSFLHNCMFCADFRRKS